MSFSIHVGLWPRARFRKRKGAIKLHTLLDLRGNIPSFIEITDGKVHDVNITLVGKYEEQLIGATYIKNHL